jgi:hypothetical protein
LLSVSALVSRLLSHYWTADDPPATRQAQLEDWIEDLACYSTVIIEGALLVWRREENRRPTPADIIKIADRMLAAEQRKLQPPLRPEPAPVHTDRTLVEQKWRWRVAAAYHWMHDQGKTMPVGIPENSPAVRDLVAMMPDPSSLEAQLHCVQREIEKRERFYPRWITEGRIKKFQAEWEIATMKAVLNTLTRLGTDQPVKLSRGR